jgi:Ca2+-binding RTX toxin-like protein/6-phosphogluconolactonase (cycloisomerase 2 family)
MLFASKFVRRLIKRRRQDKKRVMGSVDTLEPRLLLSADVAPHRIEQLIEQTEPSQFIDGFDGFLGNVEQVLETSIEAVDALPLVGNQLAAGFDPFLELLSESRDGLREGINGAFDLAGLDQNASVRELYENAVFNVFGPSGLDVLQDGDDVGSAVGVSDIALTAGIDTFLDGSPVPNSEWLQWNMHLADEFHVDIPVDTSIDFETLVGTDALNGLGFSLTTEGDLRLSVEWDAYVGWGVTLGNNLIPDDPFGKLDPGPNFYFDAAAATDASGAAIPEFELIVEIAAAPLKDAFGVEIPGSSGLDGTLAMGFVNGSITDGTVNPQTGQLDKTSFTVTASVDLVDPFIPNPDLLPIQIQNPDNQIFRERLTSRELAKRLDDNTRDAVDRVVRNSVTADGAIHLHFQTDTGALPGYATQPLGLADGAFALPEVGFDLNVEATATREYQSFFDINGFEVPGFYVVTAEIDQFSIDNVTLNVEPLISGLMLPIANITGVAFGPVFSVLGYGLDAGIGFLNRPIPLLDLIGPAMGFGRPSLLDLSGVGDQLNALFDKLDGIAELPGIIADFLANFDGLPINFGSWEYDFDLGIFNHELSFLPDSINYNDFLTAYGEPLQRGGFRLDVVEPGSMLNMLLGNHFDIVSYNLPALNLGLSGGFGFDFRVLNFGINAGANIRLDPVGIVYDSAGIEQIADAAKSGVTPDFTDLLDGFYIRNTPGRREFETTVAVSGGGGVDAGFFFATANASLGGEVFFDLQDPNNDGKLRLNEIVELTDGFSSPQKVVQLFNAGAGINGGFDFEAGIRIKVGPFKKTFSVSLSGLGIPSHFDVGLSLSDILGYSVVSAGTGSGVPSLGERITENGEQVLRISSGPFASDRIHGSTDDSGGINVSAVDGSIVVTATLAGTGPVTQSFAADVDRVVIVGTDADDIIDFSGLSQTAVEVHGLGGNDVIRTGGGADVILAGSGNDIVYAGAGNDFVVGEDGDDILHGESGDDVVSGENGNDAIFGAGGADVLSGDHGNDTLDGGDGNDSVAGGRNDDLLISLAGVDQLFGERGNDTIQIHQASHVSADGGAGVDTFLIHDRQADPDNDLPLVATLTSSDLQIEGRAVSTYSGFEKTQFELGSRSDTLTIQSTATTVSVDGGAGDLDELIVHRVQDTTDQTGTLTPSTIQGLGLGDLSYSVERLSLELGAGDDHLTVVDTHDQTTTTISGGLGSDRFTVHSVGSIGLTQIIGNSADGGDDGGRDVVALDIPGNPAEFGNLGIGVEELFIDNTVNSTSVNWNYVDGKVEANGVKIVEALGADLVSFAAGLSTDSLTVVDGVNNPQTVVVETNQVRIDEGLEVLVQEPSSVQEFTFADIATTTVDGLAAARGIDTSPDGNHIYVAGGSNVSVYRREIDRVTGTRVDTPIFIQKVNDSAGDPVHGVHGLTGANDVVVSPDGRHVYVSSAGDLGIAIFERVPLSGRLIYKEFLVSSVPMNRLEMSGNSDLYASSQEKLFRYSRNPVDGSLTYFHFAPLTGQDIIDVAVTPDGNDVFVATANGLFRNDPNTIAFTFVDNQDAPYFSVSATNDAIFAGTAFSVRRFVRQATSLVTRFETTASTGVTAIDTNPLSSQVAAGLNSLSSATSPELPGAIPSNVRLRAIKTEEPKDEILIEFYVNESLVHSYEIHDLENSEHIDISIPAFLASEPAWTMLLLESDLAEGDNFRRALGELKYDASYEEFSIQQHPSNSQHAQTFVRDVRPAYFGSISRTADIIGNPFHNAPGSNFHYVLTYDLSRTDNTLIPDELLTFNNNLGLTGSRDIASRPALSPANDHILGPGEALVSGQSMYSANGAVRLTMQPDGNLASWNGNRFIWAAGTNNANYLVMQTDGNLVLHGPAGPVWTTGTQNNPGAYAEIQTDGNLVVRSAAGAVLWGSTTNAGGNYELRTLVDDVSVTADNVNYAIDVLHGAINYSMTGDSHVRQGSTQNSTPLNRGAADSSTLVHQGTAYTLNAKTSSLTVTDAVFLAGDGNASGGHNGDSFLTAGESLSIGEFITSPNGAVRLQMQADGNVALWNGNTVLWDAFSNGGTAGHILRMQEDGHLVLYKADGVTPAWTSNTFGNDGAFAVLQHDGNFVIYDTEQTPLWSTETSAQTVPVRQTHAIDGLLNAGAMAVTNDNRHLIVTNGTEDALLIFDLATNGDISGGPRIVRDGVNGVNGLDDVSSLKISGNHLYTTSPAENTLSLFIRGSGLAAGGGGNTLGGHNGDSILAVGEKLSIGESLLSPNGSLHLDMQSDGNVALWYGDQVVWTSGTHLLGGHELRMQADGNLAVYNSANQAVWVTATDGNSNAFLSLQDDGNLVVRGSSNQELWVSNSTVDTSDFRYIASAATDLDGPRHVTTTTDRSHVYVASENNDSIVVFQVVGNSLVHQQTVSGSTLAPGLLKSPQSTMLSDNGRFVFVIGGDDSITVLARNVTDGTLSYVQTVFNKSGGVQGLDGLSSLALSDTTVAGSTDQYLFAAGSDADTIAVFKVDANSGRLSFTQRVRNGSAGVSGLDNPTALNVVGDVLMVSSGGVSHSLFSPDPGNSLGGHNGDSTLTTGESITIGEHITSPNGAVRMFMQASDGNLATWIGNRAIWAAGTNGGPNPGQFLVMQSDGNLVVYGQDLTPLWTSVTQGNPNASATLQDDGNLVIYSEDGRLLWSSNSPFYRGSAAGVGMTLLSIDAISPEGSSYRATYENVESLAVVSAGGTDVVSVRDTVINTTIATGGGGDTIVIHRAPDNQTTTLNAGADDDEIVLRSSGTGAIVTLNGDGGNDTFRVVETGDGATVLTGGTGNDVFFVDGTTLGADITVSGGTDNNTLNFDAKDGTAQPALLEGQTNLPGHYNSDGTIRVSGYVESVNYSSIQIVDLIAAPIANAGPTYNIAEGGTLQLSGQDDLGDPAVTFSWDLNGDGQFGDAFGATPVLGWTQLQGLGLDDDGEYQVALRATNAQGSDEATTTLTITNTDPIINLNVPGNLTRYVSFPLGLSSFDPGADTISSYTVDWGDGSNIETVTGPTAQLLHNYQIDGNYTVSVIAVDEDGQYSTSVNLFVQDGPPPTRTLSGDASGSEGSQYALNVTAAGPGSVAEWLVNWGDGSTSSFAGASGVLTHAYADDGNYQISAVVTDGLGATSLADNTLNVAVGNVAPVVSFTGSNVAVEGSSYTISNLATTVDPGDDTISRYIVEWGDGTVESLNAAATSATHVYVDDGDYTVRVGAQDEDGIYISPNQVTVAVSNVVPTLTLAGNASVDEGSSYTLSLSASDPGRDTITEWQINWGDGSSVETISGNPESVEHIYSDGAAQHQVSATATDEDGTFNAGNSVTVTVNDIAPTPTIGSSVRFSEVHSVRILNASGGTFRLGVGPELTAAIPVNSDAQVVQDELETLSAIGANNVTVESSTNGYTISYRGDHALNNVEDLTIDASGLIVADPQQALDASVDSVVQGGVNALEGSDVTITLASNDPGDDPVDAWSINWGDGTVQTGLPGDLASAAHTYADDGQYSITATLQNADGSFTSNQLDVTASDVAPIVAISGEVQTDTSNPFRLNLGAVVDPGDDTLKYYLVDWGDGSTFDGDSLEQFTSGGIVEHTFEDGASSHVIQVSLEDVDGNRTYGLASLLVGQEGHAVPIYLSTLDDSANHYEVNWGDGSSSTWSNLDAVTNENGLSQIEATHAYGDEGLYTASVSVVFPNGDQLQIRETTTVVGNVAPTVVAPDVVVNEGTVAINTGTWSDPGTSDVVSLTASVGSLTQNADGTWSWSFNTADGPDDSRTVTIVATDNDGATGETSFTLSVLNVAPEFDAGADAVLLPAVNGEFSRTGIAINDPGLDVWSGTVNFGEPGGNDETLSVNQSTKTFDLNHTFTNEGTFSVSVTLQDDDGESHTDRFEVDVTLNDPPTAEAGGPYTVNEGSSISLNASGSTDPDQATNTLSFEWDLDGDGIYGETGQAAAHGDETGIAPVFRTEGLNGALGSSVTVSLRVTDDHGESSYDTALVNITNVAPEVSNNGNVTANEGAIASSTGTYSDAGPDTVTLAASIGTVIKNTDGTWNWSFNTADGPDDSQTVTVTATDSDGASTSTTFDLTVNNVAPAVSNGGNVTTSEGQTATNSGTWSDPGADIVTLAASIGTVIKNADSTWNWSFNTADGPDDSQTVTVTATDSDGASTNTTFDLTVNNVAPSVASLASSNDDAGNSSDDGNVTISGAFTDPGVDTHAVAVDWGDGAFENVSVDQIADTFSGAHDYTTGGIFTITVTVTDSDGAVSSSEFTTAVVTGIGIVDGTLYIIGTNDRDHIRVQSHRRRDQIRIDAKLGDGADRLRTTYAKSDIDNIVVLALDGDDRVHLGGGGSGDDMDIDASIYGDAGRDHLTGSRGDDFIDGGAGDDRINGRRGNDTLIDLEGHNRVDGGFGNDSITTGAGNDRIHGNHGNDIIDAGDGHNDVDGGHGDDAIFTGSGNDKVSGNHGNDLLVTGAGNDRVRGGHGNDVISAGSGNDRVEGNHGRDILIGGTGRDNIRGGHGDDLIVGGSTVNEDDPAQLDAAMAAWINGDLVSALLELGTVNDDGDRDDIRGDRGRDHVISGTNDRVRR